ncbi:hypothetical protein [Colwellia piezophila]|uniref:hypothetical protein n=1 Tax=Colwellia piezophila TaxID=211668 RepID=UPI0003769E5C|nr:hypothetical protein [Colwellia piezophila]
MNNKLFLSAALLMSMTFSVSAQENTPVAEPSGQAATIQGCGEIVLYNKPPSTRNMHFASIGSIDGQTVSLKSRSFNLSAGKHIIRVQEHITEASLTRRRGEAKNYHLIEFVVEANKKYSLGAKYIRKNRNKFATGEYWAPAVWKTSDVECSA